MAGKAIQREQHVFRYESFIIDKDQPLGYGFFGAVYRARCDQLSCAAKVLHQTILDPKDKESDKLKIMERFQQECTLMLVNIRHPHIVQYLGLATDPESKLPVLLMELLDESLTKMLEFAKQPLAYCAQVNICHDIALAVAYLHSNDIIHRDLSSNNVLMIAGRRAKVTDFVMSKLADTTSTEALLTMSPGTLEYMPPEALREPPRYTKKLDCFSEGVIMIQVCTRLRPDPGPCNQLVQDARSPTESIEIPVLEPVRRKSHIELIDPTHPLLPIAMNCLEYQDGDRLSSEEICQMLNDLKISSSYQESQQNDIKVQIEDVSSNQEKKLKIQNTQQLHSEIQAKNIKLQEKVQLAQEKESQLLQELASRERLIQKINHQLEEQQKITAELQQSNCFLQQQLGDLLSPQKQTGVRFSQPQQLSPPVKHPPLFMKHDQEEEHVHRSLIKSKQKQVPMPSHLCNNPCPLPETQEMVPLLLHHQNSISSESHHKPHPSMSEKISLEWTDGGQAPLIMERGGAVSNGKIVYFVSISGESCSYSMTTSKWNVLPKCPYAYSSLAIIYDHLTAIGGCTLDNFEPQNKLVSRKGDRGWVENFPPMPTNRWKTAVVSTKLYLVVAGGKREKFSQLNTVEIMDIENIEWSTVASLPHPYSEASAAICGEQIYMLGGFDDTGKTKSVLTCSLTDLLQCRKRSTVWSRVADAPTTRSTCAVISGHLLAIGGLDAQNRKASTVYEYSTTTGSWGLISNMPTPQYNRLVTVLPTNEMIVVGGCIPFKTDTVDIAKANFTTCT